MPCSLRVQKTKHWQCLLPTGTHRAWQAPKQPKARQPQALQQREGAECAEALQHECSSLRHVQLSDRLAWLLACRRQCASTCRTSMPWRSAQLTMDAVGADQSSCLCSQTPINFGGRLHAAGSPCSPQAVTVGHCLIEVYEHFTHVLQAHGAWSPTLCTAAPAYRQAGAYCHAGAQ